MQRLRFIAFSVYLAAWFLIALVALVRAMPRRRRYPLALSVTTSALVGMVMQGTAALPITLTLNDGPLRPGIPELIGTIALAPTAVGILCWALWSVPIDTPPHTLVTSGAYSRLRHPMYLAFLLMLVATGFIASAGMALIAAIVLYVAGTELRIASEEAELAQRAPHEYASYRSNTRWRYLPGLR
jgi:protein-S-isoprenylcysteine O-methyltransferase Ste14